MIFVHADMHRYTAILMDAARRGDNKVITAIFTSGINVDISSVIAHFVLTLIFVHTRNKTNSCCTFHNHPHVFLSSS
jgi:uncharacterized membrane protein (DUF485 family)